MLQKMPCSEHSTTVTIVQVSRVERREIQQRSEERLEGALSHSNYEASRSGIDSDWYALM